MNRYGIVNGQVIDTIIETEVLDAEKIIRSILGEHIILIKETTKTGTLEIGERVY